MESAKRIVISGRALPVRGNDIDTDRIIPARYLRTVVFDGLGEHAFEDDRAQLAASGQVHPFDDPSYAGAEILIVNQNFGCGSSREHAPQAIMRYGEGIRAIIGESLAEIFYGNCLALGVPCPRLGAADVEALMALVEREPATMVRVDLQAKTVTADGQCYAFEMPEGPRQQLLEGRWDTVSELLAAEDRVRALAARLPYLRGFD
jgi:3-isopropylmalate/(R)-2-methylmalate dehydratase small subunit